MRTRRFSGDNEAQLPLFSAPPPRSDDEALRERFIRSVEENFSIIAPAGVGKTQSLVERIVSLAQHERAREWLPRLVVVTFTKRAADEMQQRAREEILRARLPLELLEQFNRAFFGTIHSFCVELLRNFGHHLGLPAQFQLLEDDDALWMDFLHGSASAGGLTAEQHTRFRRHARLQKVLRLARSVGPALPCSNLPDLDEVDFTDLLAHPAAGGGRAGIETGRELVRKWHELWCGGENFLPLPRFDKGGRVFQETWARTFAPFREWLCGCALRVAAETARQYREFRLQRALLTYDDQVAFASQLLQHPVAARQIREREYRVILDEAQDTDPAQFHVLLECTRSVQADTDWLKSRAQPPAPGRFAMVGDAQQSIYGGRADLARYESIRELLGGPAAGTELAFNTTFRCDQAIIDFINATFPRVFTDADQVAFVPLRARPGAGAGQVVRFEFGLPEDLDDRMLDRKKAIIEADSLASWLVENGLPKLRARAWHEVAILVPQRRWFSPLRIALRRVGLRTQVQSPRDIKGDSPAYAWLTALLMIVAQPRNHFEIFGVLRELFGLSDDELAHFSAGQGRVFRIDRETEADGAVAEALNLLARMRQEVFRRPLRDAVERLITATQLRARVDALPPEFFENSAPELDDLLALASGAEADEQTLSDFAETLRQKFHAQRETRAVEEKAIQLLTAHKAKGLQWDAVILPFLHRREYPPRMSYPRVLQRGAELPAMLALEKEDVSSETTERLATRRRHERQRLLYVSLTRARRTLVLSDDAALFARHGRLSRFSAAAALQLQQFRESRRSSWESSPGPNHAVWQALGHDLSAESSAAKTPITNQSTPENEYAAVTPAEIARAHEQAAHFPHRLLPSSFAGHRSDERWRLDREPEWREMATGSAAIAYGTWWHALMESLPHRDPETRASLVTAALETSPDRARSAREWELFSRSELARRIFSGEDALHAEMPMLWRKSDHECVEGVIDLALFARAAGEWLIVDWKTDLVDAPDSLRQAYGAQVAAYVEAIAVITQCSARGGLYSTATGAWVAV